MTDYSTNKHMGTIVIETFAPYSILDFDEGACKIFGYSIAGFAKAKKTLQDFIVPEDYKKTSESIDLELNISNRINTKFHITNKFGETLSILCAGQAFLASDDHIILQCNLTDITHFENAAHESEKAKSDLEKFANSVPSGVSKHLLDNNLSVIWANKSFYELCEYSVSEFEQNYGRNTFSIIYKPDLAIVINTLADLSEEHDSYADFRIVCSSGNLKWVHTIFAHSGEYTEGFPVINMVTTDITSLKDAELRAYLEKQKYEILSDITEELAFDYDIEEDILTFAERFSTFFDYDTIISNPGNELFKSKIVPPESYSALKKMFEYAANGAENYSTEFILNTKLGKQWYLSTFSTIRNEENIPIRIIGLLRNINREKTEQRKLKAQAESDLMTKLYNKVTTEGLIRETLRALTDSEISALVLVDIDNFKSINDTYGHLTGDEVITSIADAFRNTLPASDIAGRTGGDEFTLFLKNLPDKKMAEQYCTNIKNYITDKFTNSDYDFVPTLSIGIAFCKQNSSYQLLVENADTALYNTKLNGKDGFSVYVPTMQREQYINERNTLPDRTENDSTNEQNFTFINEFVNLLYMRQNTHLTLNTAIELIGSHYNIDRIGIWIYDSHVPQTLKCTHFWNKDNSADIPANNKIISSYSFEEISELSTNGSFYVSSSSDADSLNISSLNAFQGAHSFILFNVIYKEKTIGYISFISTSEDISWSEKEISQFNMIFKTMSETICNTYISNSLTAFREDMILAFNNIENPIIILNSDTFEILYNNPSATEHFEDILQGCICYNILFHQHTPCNDCPIKRIDDKLHSVKISRTINSVDYDISVSKISWSENTNAVMISTTTNKRN